MPSNRQSEARARVALDPAPFEKGAKAIVNAANSMSATITKTFAAAAGVMLAALGAKTIAGLASTVKEVITFGEEMANAGKRAGIAAGKFYLFNSAIEKGIGLKTAAALLGKNADVLNRSAEVFRGVSIKLWAVGEKIRGFWLGLMERVAPVLSTILDGALGDQLLEAGNTFGGAIANGVALVYQLAKDGKLWQTFKDGFAIAFGYAGERLKWLGKVGFGIFKYFVSEAFTTGIELALASAITSFEDLAKTFGEQIKSALNTALIFFVQAALSAFGKLNKFLGGKIGIPAIPASSLFAISKAIVGTVNEANARISGKKKGKAPQDAVGEILDNNKFEESNGLANKIADFGKGIEETFTKYKREEKASPNKTFENNTRRVTSGADSLAAIGGGGGVYVGLSMLDVNKSQLKELQKISERLGALGTNSSLTVNNIKTDPIDVSRMQKHSPVTR